MDFALTTEQLAVQSLFLRFARAEIAPGAQARDQTSQFPYTLIPRLADTGIFRFLFPEDVGGSGGDTVSYTLALEQIARVDQSVAATVANQVGLAALPIYEFGTQRQRDRWLPALFSGERLGAFALTEPMAGSDAGAASTRATRTEGGWKLSGSKMYITNSGTDLTGFVIVTARIDPPGSGERRISAFIVEPGTPGFSVSPAFRKMGWRASDTHQIFLDECFVPDDALLGEHGQGFRQFLKTLDFGRIQIATLGVGLAQAALDSALRYARERVQFGVPIFEFQGVSFKLSDMAVDVEAARLLTWHAAWRRDQTLPFSKQAAMAKLHASEVAMRAAHDCAQIHGGSSFIEESEASRLFRDARILEIGEGTSEIQRLVIARHLAKEMANG